MREPVRYFSSEPNRRSLLSVFSYGAFPLLSRQRGLSPLSAARSLFLHRFVRCIVPSPYSAASSLSPFRFIRRSLSPLRRIIPRPFPFHTMDPDLIKSAAQSVVGHRSFVPVDVIRHLLRFSPQCNKCHRLISPWPLETLAGCWRWKGFVTS